MISKRKKKILVLGGTGTMGVYLVPELADMGYQVNVVSLDNVLSNNPSITYVQADAKDISFLHSLLQDEYDAIVDFLIYSTKEFSDKYEMMLSSTDHYIFLSSYRVYADSAVPIKEDSPRLLDVSDDKEFLATEDYSLYKARQEDILKASKYDNWTIVRPAVTYSKFRYQLVTLEAANTVGRAFAGKEVVLPEQAKNIQATMSWAGDVAKMIAGLLFNEKARGETFTVATAEHHTWGEIADYYKDICNLKAVWVDKKDYIGIICPDPYQINASWQLEYDRLFDRIMDNSKVLQATGMTQADLTKLYDGLAKEIARCPKDHPWPVNARMDEYLQNRKAN